MPATMATSTSAMLAAAGPNTQGAADGTRSIGQRRNRRAWRDRRNHGSAVRQQLVAYRAARHDGDASSESDNQMNTVRPVCRSITARALTTLGIAVVGVFAFTGTAQAQLKGHYIPGFTGLDN